MALQQAIGPLIVTAATVHWGRMGWIALALLLASAVLASRRLAAHAACSTVPAPASARVRTCAGCSLLFIDRSRPGRRRWCSMDRCGNRDKTARYREKKQHA